MQVIRIFAFVETRSGEVDNPVRLIHVIDLANHPFALRHLSFHLPVRAVYQVKMTPSVPLGDPEQFFSVVEVVSVIVIIIDKSLCLLVHQMADRTVGRTHFTNDITLMAALVELERKSAAVFTPTGQVQIELVFIRSDIQCHLLACLHVKKDRQVNRQHVARLRVIAPLQDRLFLAGRTGFDQRNTAFLHVAHLHRRQLAGVGRPDDRPGVIAQVGRAVHRQGNLFFRLILLFLISDRRDIEVVIFHIRFPFLIRRDDRSRSFSAAAPAIRLLFLFLQQGFGQPLLLFREECRQTFLICGTLLLSALRIDKIVEISLLLMVLIPEIVGAVYPFGMDSGRINPVGTFQDRVGALVIGTRHLRGGAFCTERHRQQAQARDKQSRSFHNKQ